MTTSRRWPILAALVLHLSACTAVRPVPGLPEEQRSRLGAVGVSDIGAASGQLDVGPRGRMAGAAAGAWEGATWLASGPPSCSGQGCVVALGIAAAALVGGAVVGGVVGAVQAVPVDTAHRIELQLAQTLSEVGRQETLAAEVVGVAHASGLSAVVPLADTPGDEALDAVLEVGVFRVALFGSGGSDPDLTLCMLGRARLVDAASGIERYRNEHFAHASEARAFSEWSGDGGRPLADEIRYAQAALATGIVRAVWWGEAVPKARACPPTEETAAERG